jgi:cytochrome P450
MKFFFVAMLLYPEVLVKLQEEVDRVVGESRLPSLSDRGAMPYVECVLKEVYRWRPVVPLGKYLGLR